MKKSRKLLMILGIVLSLAIATGSTLAYLTDTDSDVNVMTLGNVSIKQIEKERIEQSDDNTADTNIQDFTQGKPLYPSVYDDQYADWARDDEGNQVYQGFPTGGSSAMWTDEAENAVDKIVFVENDGKSDAYVRTWFAFEQGSMTEEEFEAAVGQNINDTHWEWEAVAYGVEIDGNTYAVKMATYKGSDTVHPGGILPAGETTRPSLLQTMLYKTVTNEDCEAIDGNSNGTFDIIVLSQAVQTAGFADATAALTEAFGEPTPANVPWEEAEWPKYIRTVQDLIDAGNNGGEYLLGNDLIIDDETVKYRSGLYISAIFKDMKLNLNGYDIVVDVSNSQPSKAPVLFYVYGNGVSLTIVGEGDVVSKKDAFLIFPRGVSGGAYIYGGNYINKDDSSGTKGDINAIGYSQNGKIYVYGGTFDFKNVDGHCGGFNVYDNSGAEIVLHEGVLLSNRNYYQGSDADEIHLAEGCVLQEVEIDGETWYKVVKE